MVVRNFFSRLRIGLTSFIILFLSPSVYLYLSLSLCVCVSVCIVEISLALVGRYHPRSTRYLPPLRGEGTLRGTTVMMMGCGGMGRMGLYVALHWGERDRLNE
ncbi:hypothetical protein EJ04DRAFT_310496 [Polyplosphaeria fusca]|uniref:Uncharacterized protein n=1 Tax=Polyplosphaeria fusca TaxID=682080 RepID=A0A9P4V8D8_9PLEO|nr:hypothetical protein EJ04DRAFT_310496 [Polyplosphaeria fusca]